MPNDPAMLSAMNDLWHVRLADETLVLSRDDAVALAADGRVDADTLVWTEGYETWRTYAESGLAAVAPPPLPPSLPASLPAPRTVDEIPGAPRLEVSDEGWQVITPAPWRRYLARQLDIMLLGTLAWMCLAFVVAAISGELFDRLFAPEIVDNMIVSLLLTNVVVVPILAVVIGLTGTSPGKWVFGVRVTRRDGRPIGLVAGLRRELHVYVRGLGMAIPLVSLFTLVTSYTYLETNRVAAWDRGEPWVVTHRPDGTLQVVLFVIGLAVVVAARIALQFA